MNELKINVGKYKGMDLLIPIASFAQASGRIAYFRHFGSSCVFTGIGDRPMLSSINRPIHPRAWELHQAKGSAE